MLPGSYRLNFYFYQSGVDFKFSFFKLSLKSPTHQSAYGRFLFSGT
jgi:hypothetical protein